MYDTHIYLHRRLGCSPPPTNTHPAIYWVREVVIMGSLFCSTPAVVQQYGHTGSLVLLEQTQQQQQFSIEWSIDRRPPNFPIIFLPRNSFMVFIVFTE